MPTLVLARIVSQLAFAIAVAVTTFRLAQRETLWWTLASVFGILSWGVLIAGARLDGPAIAIIHVVFITGSIALQVLALVSLAGRRWPIWVFAMPPLVAGAIVAALQLPLGVASLLSTAVVCGELVVALVASTLLRSPLVSIRSTILMSVGIILALLSSLVRLWFGVIAPDVIADPLSTHWANTLPFVASYLGIVMVSIAWIAALKDKAESELASMAYRDSLTGLANRRYLSELALSEIARMRRINAPCALVMLDIDHFKSINDRHGHDAGDLVLVAIGKGLLSVSRQQDLAVRLGGEEFCVLLPETTSAGAAGFAERLQGYFSDHIRTPDGTAVTFSAGIAALEFSDHVIDTVLTRADRALYRAKAGGRDCIVISRSDEPDQPAVVDRRAPVQAAMSATGPT